jgi:hypothetical protein
MVPARGGISRGLNQGQSPKTEPQNRAAPLARQSDPDGVSPQRKAPFVMAITKSPIGSPN